MTCASCSRRTILHGLGVAAVIAALPSCQPESSLTYAKATTVGDTLLLDLTDPANQLLVTAGGAMLVDAASDTIMVIRSSDTAVVALSAICTHAGCSMNFDAASAIIDCPCHGSQFGEDGRVIKGPAARAIALYASTLATTQITITT